MTPPGEPGRARPDPGSFRDPTGRVFELDGRILRVVRPAGAAQYQAFRDSGLLRELVDTGLLCAGEEIPCPAALSGAGEVAHVLEHPPLPIISYPYEWPFPALKAAALFHLQLQVRALDKGFALSDATAYNVQFDGTRPVFIDHLSFRPYRDGEFWLGHRQFCEQFLNPLLLAAWCGLPYHAGYRASLAGTDGALLARLLPWYRRLQPLALLHVTLPAWMQGRHGAEPKPVRAGSRLPRPALKNMLEGLHRGIASLEPRRPAGLWSEYAGKTVYDRAETRHKHEFVRRFVSEQRPAMVWDLGCNTGDYAATCLQAGATRVAGFEGDGDAATLAFDRAVRDGLAFLPLVMDLANPSPAQGWRGAERRSLAQRRAPDGVLALALLHHLVIQGNIPLDDAIDWIISLAPRGVIEFVPKTDPMVRRMLTLREDIFPEYTEAVFRDAVSRRARITQEAHVTEAGRLLVSYQR